MKNAIQILLVILAIQALATVFAFSGDSQLERFTPEVALFDNLTLENLTEVRIVPGKDEDQGDANTLVKQDGTWVLKNYFNFPVASRKLDTIRDELLILQKPYPVGSTAIATKQFEVSEDTYKTKIEFVEGDTVKQTIYFGSSPTFKKVHARLNDSDLTYSLPFSAFSVKGKPSTWIDRQYLKAPLDQVTEVAFEAFTLKQQTAEKPSLTLADLKEGEELDSKKAGALLKAASTPGFLEILSETEEENYNLKTPTLSYTIHFSNGSERTILLGEIPDEKYYVMKASDKPFYFKVSSFQAEKLTKATRESLLQEPTVVEQSTDESSESEEVAADTKNEG